MKKATIHLAVYDTMADWEYGYVVAHINSPEFQKSPGHFEIRTVGETLEPITTKGGIRILPDMCLDNLSPTDSQLLILPGADTAAEGGIELFVDMAARYLSADVPVAAICGATAALAKRGLLDELPHTSNAKEFLQMTGYKGSDCYIDKPAVTGGNLITASGVAPVAFAAEIFRMLGLYADNTLEAWWQLFEHKDPAGFYQLMEEHSK